LSESFANSPLEVLHGSKVIEVRPQGYDKGKAFKLLRQRLGEEYDFVFFAGDDRTDEDLFRTLTPEDWSIKVGAGATKARFRVDSPAAFRDLLRQMAQRRS
jgi:trehalose 6-phosphate synthase/phosphatase